MAGIWTEEREKALRLLFNCGASATEISAALSQKFGIRISRNAVIGVWHRRGWTGGNRKLPTKRRSPEPRQAVQLAKRERVKIIQPPPSMPKQNKKIRRLMPTCHGSFRLIETIEQEHGVEPLREVQIQPLLLNLLDLGPDQCRYPFGQGPFLFCALPRDVVGPYCSSHRILCEGVRGADRTGVEKRKREYLRAARATA